MKVTIRRSVLRDTIAWLHEQHNQFNWDAWVSNPEWTIKAIEAEGSLHRPANEVMDCGTVCCIAGYMAIQYAHRINGKVDHHGDVYTESDEWVSDAETCAVRALTGVDHIDDRSLPHLHGLQIFGYFLFYPWGNANSFYQPWHYVATLDHNDVTEAIKRLEWLLDGKDPFLYNSDEETRDGFFEFTEIKFEFEYID